MRRCVHQSAARWNPDESRAAVDGANAVVDGRGYEHQVRCADSVELRAGSTRSVQLVSRSESSSAALDRSDYRRRLARGSVNTDRVEGIAPERQPPPHEVLESSCDWGDTASRFVLGAPESVETFRGLRLLTKTGFYPTP